MERFRTELFGFNKEDVSRYIQKLSRSAKDYDNTNSERCAELEKELAEFAEKLSDISAKLEKANKELDEKNKQLQKYANAYTELCSKITNAIKDSEEAVLNNENI